jgi:ribosomal protein L15
MKSRTTKARSRPQARRSRYRFGLRQDRRPRRQGSEGPFGRCHQRLRRRPDANLSSPAEARLQQHLRIRIRHGIAGRLQTAIDAKKLDPKATVDAAALKAAGVIRRAKDGVRILSGRRTEGKGDDRSRRRLQGRVEKIEKAGGSSSCSRLPRNNRPIKNARRCFTPGDFAPICEPHELPARTRGQDVAGDDG